MFDQNKHDREACVRYSIKLNKVTDADIIKALDEADSKQGYIKELIRKDIKKEGE